MNQQPQAQKPPTPAITAAFDPQNPKLQQDVADFIEASGGAGLSKDTVEVKPNTDFAIPNPQDVILTEALVSTDKVEVTDEEKSMFVKSLLNDTPILLTVSLMGGQMNVTLRSRTVHEQRRIFDVIEMDKLKGTISKDDLAYTVTRLQQYCMVLIVRRVNGNVFSEAEIPDGATVEEARQILHKAVDSIQAKNSLRWTTLLNAMRIFEAKCAKLNTEAANSDFWTPREQG
jgi:hypothetical protein